ncbi:hypothetical protein GCM10009802_21460 [Streptomyces synnematoformans]|uniref:Uncharacterized protein n=1 Tax=Streptomyces synnematoformans TaxID=415721 RepID=A0ABN2Y216_9ACTN
MTPEKHPDGGWANPTCHPNESAVTRHGTELWCGQYGGSWKWGDGPAPSEGSICVDEGEWDMINPTQGFVCRNGQWQKERLEDWRHPSSSASATVSPRIGKIP